MRTFQRNLIDSLMYWKNKPGRLPLILWGTRQVGKSTAIEAFGESAFPRLHVFNFQKNASLKIIFEGDLNPREIVSKLSVTAKSPIHADDLIFFDEIQDCPEAVTSLKYFSEALPHQAVISAGSHLGLIKGESAFPVGKVEFLSLHPMTYFEFLENMEPETHSHLITQDLFNREKIDGFFHQRALHWLRLYFALGGMPEAVRAFHSIYKVDSTKEREAMLAAREIQNRLLEGYRSDFSKYSGAVNANHILRVFDAAALQLGRAQDESVSKFKFSGVIPSKKGFEGIDGPLTWLEKSRLVIKTHIANRFEQPIKAFTQANHFKVYLFDIGILNAMLDIPVESLLSQDLGMHKGYLTENFVAQELFASLDHSLVAWSENESEIEFVISRGANLCPIEVKSASRSRRAKSLSTLIGKYHPELSIKLTAQNRGYQADKKIVTLPLYMAGNLTLK